MKKKLVIKFLIVFLIMLIAVPVLAEGGVSVESISGSSQNKDVVLNATDKIDIQFNELEQSAEYNLTLKNNTDKIVYVHDVVAENLSEEFIDFSLTEKSVDTQIEPGKEGKINVLVETLDIDHAGRNVEDQITLKILLGNSVLNPSTNSSLISIFLIVFMIALFYFMMTKRFDKLNIISIFIIGGLMICVTTVYANNNYATVEGKVKFVSKNLLQGSGIVLNGSTLDYSNAIGIWKDAAKVKKILISDDKNEIKEFEEKFDLTSDSSKKVEAYFVKNVDVDVPYDLHIQADGVIYAPADATGLFAFSNVESIEGLNNIEFDETTKMTAMFKGNKKLKELNVSAIDMSAVTDTSYMFDECDELEVSEDDFTLNDTVIKDNMFPTKIVNVVSGDINTIGSIVAIGDEKFYVIGQDDSNVKLLAMYNLNVGDTVTEDDYWGSIAPMSNIIENYKNTVSRLNYVKVVSPSSTPIVKQDENAKAYNWDIENSVEIFPFIGVVFSGHPAIYSGSMVEEYTNDYASYLKGLGANIEEARLISIDELEALGCDWSCEESPKWVYATTYWTEPFAGDFEMQSVQTDSYFFSGDWSVVNYSGVRPVIEIPISEF